MTFESLLEDEIYLQTTASSQNELGEWEYTYTTISTAINARMVPISDVDRRTIAGRWEDATLKAYVDYSVSVSPGDRIVYNSDTYLVDNVVWDSSKHHKTLILEIL